MGDVIRLQPYRADAFSSLTPLAYAEALPSSPLLLSDSPERLTKKHQNCVLARMRSTLDEHGMASVRAYLWHLNEAGRPLQVGLQVEGAEIERRTGAALIHPNYYHVGMELARFHLFGEGGPVPPSHIVPNRRLLGALCEVQMIGEPGAAFTLQSYASSEDAPVPDFASPCAELQVHPRGGWPFSSLCARPGEAINVAGTTEIGLCESGGPDQEVFGEAASSLHDGPSRTNRGLWGVDARYSLELTNPSDRDLEVVAEIVARNTGGVFHGAIHAEPSGIRGIIPPLEHGRKNGVQVPLAAVPAGASIDAEVRIAFGGAATLPATLRIRSL